MNEIEQLSNLTKVIQVPTGGIGTTLWVNTIICTLMLLAFISCVIWLPPFDLKKKKKISTTIRKSDKTFRKNKN